MTIKGSNGFVGIGTTNPQESLHVNGHILIPSDKKLKIGSAYNSNSGYMTIANSSSYYNTAIDIKGQKQVISHEIDISSLSNGFYLLWINGETHQLIVQ